MESLLAWTPYYTTVECSSIVTVARMTASVFQWMPRAHSAGALVKNLLPCYPLTRQNLLVSLTWYSQSSSPLVIPSKTPQHLQSREGIQQGDPRSVPLPSLTIQLLIQRLPRKCNLCLIRWYADDGSLVGRTESVTHAPRLLTTHCPRYSLHFNAVKTLTF